jgi:RND family efflux transporter MFP subunit
MQHGLAQPGSARKRSFSKQMKMVLIVICILMMGLPGCGGTEDRNTKPNPGSEAAALRVPIQITAAEMSSISVTNTYSGTLEGEEQANIVPKISERITGVGARVGEHVTAGRVIVSLDKSGPSSQYPQAEANFRNAERTLERMRSLYEEGAISLQALDGAQTAYDVAKANFEAARGTVELATPIAGVVTAVNANIGDLANPGTILATVATIRRMKVIFNINESDVVNLSIGQTVEVYSEARPDAKVEGKIIQVSKSADPRSRSFEIRALFPNTAERWFKPGMFCRVSVRISSGKTVVIPSSAIQSDGITARMFTVRKGRAFSRTVQPGVTDGQFTAIVYGLAEGETVATVGMNNLKDSSLVKIVNR